MLKYIVPRKVSPEIKKEQLAILRDQKASVLIASLIIAVISVFIFWPVVNHQMILLWLVVIASVSTFRIGFCVLYKHKYAIKEWARSHLIGTFITGVAWGSLAFFFDPQWPAYYQVALCVLFVGIITAAFISNLSVFTAFLAFMLPVISCLIFVLEEYPGEGYYKIVFLVIAYALVMYEAALRYHGHIVDYLEVRHINDVLSNKLLQASLELQDLVDTDGLTQIANRRTLDKSLLAEWNRHFRNKKPLSFIFIDIDYFKQYNDTYGHQEGDKCLVRVANVISKNVKRSSDVAARYGGEEFAVILPETEAKYALTIAEKIREQIADENIPHKSSSVAEHVTVSLGVASIIPDKQYDEKSLSASADMALYQAKANGRNQSVLWKEETA